MGMSWSVKIWCDGKLKNCRHNIIEVDSRTVQGVVNEARKLGWAVSRDRRKFYCPDCAKYYRTGVRSRW